MTHQIESDPKWGDDNRDPEKSEPKSKPRRRDIGKDCIALISIILIALGLLALFIVLRALDSIEEKEKTKKKEQEDGEIIVVIIKTGSEAGQGATNVTTTTVSAAAVTSCVDVPELCID